MKFPVRMSNKKCVSKMNTEKSSKDNSKQESLHQEFEPQVIKMPNTIPCDQENRLPTHINNENVPLNINMNAPTHVYPWPMLSNNSEVLENFDTDGRLFGTFKRISFDRSMSWDDSGFNSCTSEDRDDFSVSDRSSFDSCFLADDEDEHSVSATKQIPVRFRQRSYSLDSESSDVSDLHNYQNSKASSSKTFTDLDKNLVLWRDSSVRLFSDQKVSRRKKLVNSNNGIRCGCNSRSSSKVCLTGTDTDTSDISVHPSRPTFQKRKRMGKDLNNNTQRTSIIKNLKSYKKHSSPCMNHCFQERGLLTLVSCVFYTLVLGFVIGVCGLLYQAIKSFTSKEDFQDLRQSAIKSRQNDKMSSLDKTRHASATALGNV